MVEAGLGGVRCGIIVGLHGNTTYGVSLEGVMSCAWPPAAYDIRNQTLPGQSQIEDNTILIALLNSITGGYKSKLGLRYFIHPAFEEKGAELFKYKI